MAAKSLFDTILDTELDWIIQQRIPGSASPSPQIRRAQTAYALSLCQIAIEHQLGQKTCEQLFALGASIMDVSATEENLSEIEQLLKRPEVATNETYQWRLLVVFLNFETTAWDAINSILALNLAKDLLVPRDHMIVAALYDDGIPLAIEHRRILAHRVIDGQIPFTRKGVAADAKGRAKSLLSS